MHNNEDENIMRILVAEDDAGVRAFLLRAIQHACPDCVVEAVADGAEALDAFKRHPADLVISDQHMPHLMGVELLRAIRSFSAVPFVLISADSRTASVAYAAGCSSFLDKPVKLEALRAVISNFTPSA